MGPSGTGGHPPPGFGAGQCPLLLWNRLQQKRDGNLRRIGNDRGGLRLLPLWNSHPKDGRWINRDPIAEQEGWNLYAFLGNSLQDKFDALGLEDKKKDKEFLGYVYDQILEGTDIYICETTGLKINDKILNNTVSESMNAFKEANSANQAASNIRYAKDFSKKVSKLYKLTPGTKIPGVKISSIKDIIDFIYIKRDEKVAYQQFYKAATRYQTLKKKTFSSCFELCVAMGEYAKVFLKNDLGKGIVKFSTVYCISKCNKRHKTLD